MVAPTEIRRENQRRIVEISAALTGEVPLGAVVSALRENLKDFELPPGVYQVDNLPFDGTTQADSGGPNEGWIEREVVRLKEHPLVCRHGTKYGTRCSHKLLVHRDGANRSKVWHLDGYPCEGRFRQVLGDTVKGT